MFPFALAMIYWLHAPLDTVNPYGSGNNNHSSTSKVKIENATANVAINLEKDNSKICHFHRNKMQ